MYFHRKSKLWSLGVAASFAGLSGWIVPALAASPGQVSDAIRQAKILAAGTNLKVRLGKDQASISLFKNRRANDKDCKIEAILIGKTVFETEGIDVARVAVYFYDSSSPTQFKTVTVTKGDVTAFGSGELSKEDLLASIAIKSGGSQDLTTAIENQLMLMAASKRQDVTIQMAKDEVVITTAMPANSPVRELKYEALRIADIAMAKIAKDPNLKRVKVVFFSPGQPGLQNQVAISIPQIKILDSEVQRALRSVQLVRRQRKVSAKELKTKPGLLEADRKALLESLIELEEMGVGIDRLAQEFSSIEQQVDSGEEPALQKAVESLDKKISSMKENYQKAKAFKATPSGNNEAIAADKKDDKVEVGPRKKSKRTKSRGKINRWALGHFPLLQSSILANPDKYLAQCKQDFEKQEKKRAESSPKFVWALLWFAEVLKTNDRAQEATKFERQAQTLSARLRQRGVQ